MTNPDQDERQKLEQMLRSTSNSGVRQKLFEAAETIQSEQDARISFWERQGRDLRDYRERIRKVSLAKLARNFFAPYVLITILIFLLLHFSQATKPQIVILLLAAILITTVMIHLVAKIQAWSKTDPNLTAGFVVFGLAIALFWLVVTAFEVHQDWIYLCGAATLAAILLLLLHLVGGLLRRKAGL